MRGHGAAARPRPIAGLSQEANQAFLAANAKKAGVIIRPDGLQFRIIQNGYGKRPTVTDSVKVYYTGTLINGTVFDGTSPGLPASFKVNSVIPGWIEALQLMREGDHWQLVIPPNLAYGARGAGDGTIPPDQVLVFDMHAGFDHARAQARRAGLYPRSRRSQGRSDSNSGSEHLRTLVAHSAPACLPVGGRLRIAHGADHGGGRQRACSGPAATIP